MGGPDSQYPVENSTEIAQRCGYRKRVYNSRRYGDEGSVVSTMTRSRYMIEALPGFFFSSFL